MHISIIYLTLLVSAHALPLLKPPSSDLIKRAGELSRRARGGDGERGRGEGRGRKKKKKGSPDSMAVETDSGEGELRDPNKPRRYNIEKASPSPDWYDRSPLPPPPPPPSPEIPGSPGSSLHVQPDRENSKKYKEKNEDREAKAKAKARQNLRLQVETGEVLGEAVRRGRKLSSPHRNLLADEVPDSINRKPTPKEMTFGHRADRSQSPSRTPTKSEAFMEGAHAKASQLFHRPKTPQNPPSPGSLRFNPPSVISDGSISSGDKGKLGTIGNRVKVTNPDPYETSSDE